MTDLTSLGRALSAGGRAGKGKGGQVAEWARGKGGTHPPYRIVCLYRQAICELRKVVWPSRRQLSMYTTVVIGFTLIAISAVSVLDFLFRQSVRYAFG
ncbi:preprotein translocase subunit SecE [Actinomycetota bacterium Odt1-20B]